MTQTLSVENSGLAGITSPPGLPSVARENAKLPQTYEAAKTALAECSQIDECQDWADKAMAMASYAKQVEDNSLRQMADRIHARALRRCGELLKQYNSPGKRTDQPNEGTHTRLTQKQAATNAGLSEHKRVTAVRVANVTEDDFNEQVESDNPPTVTDLAEQGKKSGPTFDLQGRDPEDFMVATRGHGNLRDLAEFADQNDPAVVARGTLPREYAEVRAYVATIDHWLDRLVTQLEG